ncbi:MAG: xylulokinase [Planctomycetota bacterium]
MDAPLFLGLDVGTQGTKALLVDVRAQEVVGRGAASYGLIPGLPVGHCEQDPATWIGAVARAAREALEGADPGRVKGIGVSGQQHGAVALDREGRPVRPAKLWCDTSTVEQARALSVALGRPVPAGYTASKLLWLKQREPESWARTEHVLLPHDYVNFRLTGRMVMEPGDASGTGFFDPVLRAFDERAMAAIDGRLPSMLPPLLEPGAPAGTLSAGGAALLGLEPGVLVSAGGGDNMMSAIGAGATREGVFVLSLGTSATIFTRTERCIADPTGAIAPFCSSDGAWLPLLCVMNATKVLEEVCLAFGLGHEELCERASRLPLGGDGLHWLVFLQGERVPDLPEAAGSLLGMRPGCLDPGRLYRAAIEGVACSLGHGLSRMRALGLDVGVVRLAGGASANPVARSVLADVLGAEVVPLLEPESAALGAALQAAWTESRARGCGLDLDELASGFALSAAPPSRPAPENTRAARALVRRHAEWLERIHGVRPG